jgi:hypothetical protein
MSSGLEVKESKLKSSWEKKRIWINLNSLGFSSLYFGRSTEISEEENKEAVANRIFKSAWLQHMMLKPDLKSETDGIQVRAIQGLEGVDYLTPGALTNHVSYVFGPVIAALLAAGYQANVNLEAAGYDWRLPPSELEARDGYFTNVISQVEHLYERNNNMPVVLLCHSLGTKTAHYFLNFVKEKRGQAWLDTYIHTYMPVGAPHLGAPKALRSTISGDKMSLDAFLSSEEALSLGRSLGSGPWLFPEELPDSALPTCYVRPQGVLEIELCGTVFANDLVAKRHTVSKPNRYQLIAAYGNSQRVVPTPFHRADNQDRVSFEGDKIFFATATNPQKDSAKYVQLFLQEPGLSAAKYERERPHFNPIYCLLKCIFCCCICDLAYKLIRCLTCGIWRSVMISADAVTGAVGGSSNLAFSEPILLTDRVWAGKPVELKLDLYHRDDYGKMNHILCFLTRKTPRAASIQIRIKWTPYSNEKSFRRICSPIAQPSMGNDSEPQIAVGRKKEQYQEFSGYDIMEREGLQSILRVIKDTYDGDSTLGPRSISSYDPPPVRRVHSIYGINMPTEVGAIYKRKDTCLSSEHLQNLYKLDSKARIDKKSGHSLSYGLIMETPKTTQAAGQKGSGDGTVPLWSLQHVWNWQGPCDVSVVELDKAEHRAILADPRFHRTIIKYCSQEGDKHLNQAKIIPEMGVADEENQAFEVRAPLSIMKE